MVRTRFRSFLLLGLWHGVAWCVRGVCVVCAWCVRGLTVAAYAFFLGSVGAVLMEHTKTDHGYHENSRAVKYLLEVLTELSPEERRKFLLWVTGSPRLPIGGTYISCQFLICAATSLCVFAERNITYNFEQHRLEGPRAQAHDCAQGSHGPLSL